MNNDRPPAWNIGKVLTINSESSLGGLIMAYTIRALQCALQNLFESITNQNRSLSSREKLAQHSLKQTPPHLNHPSFPTRSSENTSKAFSHDSASNSTSFFNQTEQLCTLSPRFCLATPPIIFVRPLCACVIAHTGARVTRRAATILVGGDNTGMTIGLRKDWRNDGGTENELERRW